MGCSSSKELIKAINGKDEEDKELSNPQEIAEMKKLQKKISIYQSVSFATNLLMNSNLLLYTSYINTTSDFNSIMENSKEKLEKLTFKSSNYTQK